MAQLIQWNAHLMQWDCLMESAADRIAAYAKYMGHMYPSMEFKIKLL